MSWETPLAFWGLVPVLFLGLLRLRFRGRSAVTFSSVHALSGVTRSRRHRLMWLPDAVFLLAALALVLALARPQLEVTQYEEEHKGIAIEIVVDISSSMDMDVDARGTRRSRLEVAKQVVESFVVGDGNALGGRPHDLIGIITFARYTDTVCPLTLGHDAVVQLTRDITIGDRPNEDGTAYGDATALAAAHLAMYESRTLKREDELIKSKVIVLLTDGENNSGEQSPLVAAALAKEWGIKIYTISLGEKPSNLKLEIQGEAIVVPPDESVTEETLRKMAEMTGGIFRTAYDLDSLESVYAEIDQLERSDLRPIQYADREEVFWMFALFGVLGLVVELGLRSTVFRRVP